MRFLHQAPQRQEGKGPGVHHGLQSLIVSSIESPHEQWREELNGQILQNTDGQNTCLSRLIATRSRNLDGVQRLILALLQKESSGN